MLESYEWKSQIYLHPPDKINDIYYKVCCYWNAKTEMYDSFLADSYLYDSAYITNSKFQWLFCRIFPSDISVLSTRTYL